MKKYLALFLFAAGLLLLPPEPSQAHIAPKEIKIVQGHPARLSGLSRIALSPEQGKMKAVGGRTMKNGGHEASSRNRKNKKRHARKSYACSQAPPIFDSVSNSGENELLQYYENWRGTRYRAGGTSHAGIDCSGFTALTFRDVYGVSLPRTAREQAMQGVSVGRNGLLPGDLVFFKRGRNASHVGIYLGNGSFMHASTSQGVIISSIDNVYWRNKFWKGSRLQSF